jgi:ATP-dependent Clp endopeptidase proteolytic subunit ClpP
MTETAVKNEDLQKAEAAKALAEAEVAKETAAKLRAERRKEEALASIQELKAAEAKFQHDSGLADDDRNFIYRYNTEVNATSVKVCMSELTAWSRMNPGVDIEVIFSSPGGSVIDGLALFDFLLDLRSKGHKIITGMQGMAASMAAILLQAGDVRWTGTQAWYLIHEASFGAVGTLSEVKDRAKWIEEINKRVIKIFAHRSTLSEEKIEDNFERRDWWIGPEDSLKYGFVDEIRGELPPARS